MRRKSDIEVIIATYNRPEKVLELINQLKACEPAPAGIIVVDSSDQADEKLLAMPDVSYIRTSHKNQPYQRYLGYTVAKAENLLFLDDDMEPVNTKVFERISALLNVDGRIALAIHFEDKHKDTSLAQIPVSGFSKLNNNRLNTLKRKLTAYPELAEGRYAYCGMRGPQPKEGGKTEWFSGGAFAVKRAYMYKNFNFQLFDLYEKGLGKGEDAITAYTLSKSGEIYYHPELMFWHNDQQNSAYAANIYQFSKRVSYSRLYLTLEKARLDNASVLKAWLLYHYYAKWRIFGLLLNFVLKPVKKRRLSLTGFLAGWLLSCKLTLKDPKGRMPYWKAQAIETKENI